MKISDWIRENVSILDYAGRSGYTPIKKGKYYSLKEHDSVMIDVEKNCYWQNSVPGYGSCIGNRGSVIDFAMIFNNLSFTEAIRELSEEVPNDIRTIKKKSLKKETMDTKLILPEKDKSMKKVFAYLIKSRRIAPEVVQEFVDRGMLYQDTMGNCVFVGYDMNHPDKPVFACKRGTNTYKPFYGDVAGCDYNQCFYVDYEKDTVVVTESVVDAMSYMTLCKSEKYGLHQFNYLALGGVGKWEAIKLYLQKKEIKRVIIATDNDKGGIAAAQQMCCFIRENHPEVKRRWNLPRTKEKDWNGVLQKRRS